MQKQKNKQKNKQKKVQFVHHTHKVLGLHCLPDKPIRSRLNPPILCKDNCSIISKLIVIILFLMSSKTNANSDVDLFNMPLEDLLKVKVVTSAKLPRSIKNSPGTITVFTAKEITLFGARDLMDVLTKIPGVLPFNDAFTGKYRFSIRGDQTALNNNHVLILLNGIPFNREGYIGGIWTGPDVVSVPISAVKQIEVVRGPGSVLYGTNAFSGVVNIITKDAEEINDAITLGMGDHQTTAADLSYGSSQGDLKIISALRLYETAGAAVSSNVQNANPFKSETGETTPSVLLGLKYRDFHALLHAATAELETIRGLPTQLADGEIATDKIYFNFGYAAAVSDEWSTQIDFSHIRRRTKLADSFVAPAAPFEIETDDSRLELQFRGNLYQDLTLILGTAADWNVGQFPVPGDLIDDWEYAIFSVYGQLEYTFHTTRFIVGAQYNRVETAPHQLAQQWVPRFAVIQDFTQYTGLKLQYAEAFRAPYPAETGLHGSTPSIAIQGNPQLDHELVTTWDLEFFFHSDTLQSSINFFRNEQQDLISRVPTAPKVVTFQNQGELTIEGVELEAKYLLHNSYYFSGAISTQQNENSSGIDDVTLQPRYIAKLGVGYESSDCSIGLFDNYLSGYEDNISVTPNRMEINPHSKAVHLLSLNANWSPSRLNNIKLELYIHNLLDENIYVPPMPGFTNSAMNSFPSVDTGRAVIGSITFAF